MKNIGNKGITLIALIITIIILLILAGITISSINGESGLFSKAKIAREETKRSNAKEKLNIKLLEFQTKKISEEGKNLEIDDLVDWIDPDSKYYDSEIISIMDNPENKSKIVEIDKFYFEITEKFEINDIKESSTETTYEVISTNENIMKIKVKIKNIMGINKVITPDGEEVTPDKENKTKIEINYEVTNGQEYIFKVQTLVGNKEFKEYKLIPNIDSKPIIETGNMKGYPVLTNYGIKVDCKVKISFEEDKNNYYSLDEGKTWRKYEQEISIDKQSTVIAKTIVDGEITKETKKQIQFNLADDALQSQAYDNDANTFVTINHGETRVVKVDETMWGKNAAITLKSENAGSGFKNQVECKDASGNVLSSFNVAYSYNWENKAFYIPENTITLEFTANNYDSRFYFEIYEVREYNVPVIKTTFNYALLKNTGVEPANSYVEVQYAETSQRKLYKINEGQWKDYNGKILLNVGETVYCKGVDKDGKESIISSFTPNYADDALQSLAYDNNTNTFVTVNHGETKIIKVDETMWGKNAAITLKSENAGSGFKNQVECKDASGNVLSSFNVAYSYNWENKAFYIPENTITLEFTANNYDSRFYFEIYEVREYNTPVIKTTFNYALIKNTGIETPCTKVDVEYFETSVKRLYKINDGEWKEYKGTIRLNIGETIYCKGIDENNGETIISSYSSTYKDDTLQPKAYDNDKTSYEAITHGNTRVISVDSSMWGKNVLITLVSGNAGSGFKNKVECKDASGNVLNSFNVAYSYEWTDKEFNIPENTSTLEFYAHSFDSRFYMNIYEISVQQ